MKNKLLTFTALMPLALAFPAYAQGADEQVAQEDQLSRREIEEIVVTGRPLAQSAAAALALQHESPSLVSVLSADAVGNLPDQNIAFAIGRLPGVGVERDQGQARYVNLRGAPVYWTTLSFDGLSVVSPQGRESRFDNIPSAIASQIVVQKAVTPNMQGASVAGNVDIRTQRAFDYDGQHISGKAAGGYVVLGGGVEADSSLVYSNLFADKNLGVVLQASYYMRDMATDNWETDPYLANTTDPTKRFAREHENKHYRLTRTNISGSGRVDYRWGDNNNVFASTIYTLYHDDELRDNFILRLDQGTNAAGAAYTSAAYIGASDPKLGTSYGARLNARIDYRNSKEKMSTSTIGGEHAFSDWNVSWRGNYTFTQDGRDTPVTGAFQSPGAFNLRPTVVFDLRDTARNTVTLYSTGGLTGARTQGAQVTNIENFQFPAQTMGRLLGGDITNAYTGKLDIGRDTSLFGDTRIDLGGLYTARSKKSRETAWTRTYTTGTIPTWNDFATSEIPYQGTQNLNYTFRYTDKDRTIKFVDDLISSGLATRQNTDGNYWKVREDITAGYIMGTTKFDWGSLVYGVRVEHAKNTGEAYVAFPAVGPTPAQTRLVRASSSNTLFYPSAHLNWDISQELKARVGITTSASRPDFDDLRPNFTIDDSTQTISGGNPTVTPEKQVGADAYLEWYMQPAGYFAVGAFYKDISNALIQTSGVFGQDTLDLPTLDRSNYTFNGIANAGDGHLKGVEVAYQNSLDNVKDRVNLPDWMYGLGVNLSATWTSSKITLPAALGVPARSIKVLGTSAGVYNIQATYERYGLSVRLAYQYRTPFGQSIGAYRVINGGVYPTDNGDIFWDADGEMDLSIRYRVNRNLEAYFDAMNLTNEGARRYADNPNYPIEYEKFGQRIIGGVRFNF